MAVGNTVLYGYVIMTCLWLFARPSYIPKSEDTEEADVYPQDKPNPPMNDLVVDPLYPFGYDLSFARFEYRAMDLSYQNISKSNLTVELYIANVGDADGDEVVQCYISWVNSSLPVPREQLVHFDRVHLPTNSDLAYAFTLTWMSWAYWDNGTWVVGTGEVRLCCGDQPPQPLPSPTILCSQFPVYQ